MHAWGLVNGGSNVVSSNATVQSSSLSGYLHDKLTIDRIAGASMMQMQMQMQMHMQAQAQAKAQQGAGAECCRCAGCAACPLHHADRSFSPARDAVLT